MDGEMSSASFNIESILASVTGKDSGKKNMGMGGDRLAELALLDPKRAKRYKIRVVFLKLVTFFYFDEV